MIADRIELHVELTGLVVAHFVGGAEAAKIKDLFGTDRIPTPYTFAGVRDVEIHAANVIGNIRRLNPTVTVVWCAERCAEFVAFWEVEDLKRAVLCNVIH
jgi:hypothetical protein